MTGQFVQSDVDFAVFMATRRKQPRKASFIPPAEQQRRDYDQETERLRSFIRVNQAKEGHAA